MSENVFSTGVTMPPDPTAPAPKSTDRFWSRHAVPRGMLVGVLCVLALTWGLYLIQPGGSILSAQVQTGLYVGLLALTVCSRRAKARVVRTFQRYTLNPLGLAILETRGHRTGRIRRNPVGNGRQGDSFWIIAEHGSLAGWVHNIRHDPRVRVRLRIGLRYRWVSGIATVRPDEDPLAR